jgi:transcriptional regulator with XRE-family HTH domain
MEQDYGVGREVKRLREVRRWSQSRLAVEAKMSVSGVSMIENGHRNLSTATLAKLAEALEVEVGDLFPKAQAPLPLEESAAGAPLLEKLLEAARQDARKTSQDFHRAFSAEVIPQTATRFAEDEVRAELRNRGFPDTYFEALLWPLVERVVRQEERIIGLERQLKVKEREAAERLETETSTRT